jgi:hypothetical protein
MTIPFRVQGASAKIAYADDSTDTATELVHGSFGAPNSLYIFNPDAANVVAVSYGFNSLSHNAIVPNTGFDGEGVVVGPGQSVQVLVDNKYQTASLWISVAGDSATGNVFVTPGWI